MRGNVRSGRAGERASGGRKVTSYIYASRERDERRGASRSLVWSAALRTAAEVG